MGGTTGTESARNRQVSRPSPRVLYIKGEAFRVLVLKRGHRPGMPPADRGTDGQSHVLQDKAARTGLVGQRRVSPQASAPARACISVSKCVQKRTDSAGRMLRPSRRSWLQPQNMPLAVKICRWQAFRYCFSCVTVFAPNFSCNRFRIMPKIMSKLSCAAV